MDIGLKKAEDFSAAYTQDAKFNKADLANEILKELELHSKYLDYWVVNKDRLNKMKVLFNKFEHLKKRFYMDGVQGEKDIPAIWKIKEHPGKVILKGEQLTEYLNGDDDWIVHKNRLDEQDLIVKTLELILDKIKFRSQSLVSFQNEIKRLSGA